PGLGCFSASFRLLVLAMVTPPLLGGITNGGARIMPRQAHLPSCSVPTGWSDHLACRLLHLINTVVVARTPSTARPHHETNSNHSSGTHPGRWNTCGPGRRPGTAAGGPPLSRPAPGRRLDTF